MKKITALLLCLVGFGPAYGAKFQTLEEALTQTAAKIAQNAFIPKNSKMAVVGFLESTSRVRYPLSSVLEDDLSGFLIEKAPGRVIAKNHIDTVLRELKISRDDIFDTRNRKQFGRLATARTNMAEQVKSTIRSEFARALEAGNYDDSTGGYLKDVFFSAVDNLTVNGIVMQETYLQRLLESDGLQERMYYRAYVLARISVQDYNGVVKRAFTDTKAQVQANKSAKELVKETEARFWGNQGEDKQ